MKKLLGLIIVLMGTFFLVGVVSAMGPATDWHAQKQMQIRADNRSITKAMEAYHVALQPEAKKGNRFSMCMALRMSQHIGMLTICVHKPTGEMEARVFLLVGLPFQQPIAIYVAGTGLLKGYYYRAWGQSLGLIEKGIRDYHRNLLIKHDQMRNRRFLAACQMKVF